MSASKAGFPCRRNLWYTVNNVGGERSNDIRTQRIFEEMSEILDGDTGWASEEEMIADLAEFRRKRMAGNEDID